MFRKIYTLLIVALALGFTSCESYFGDVNVNPNSPIDASVDVMLTSVAVEVADVYGGDFARYSSILTQHCEGVARQWSSANNYTGYVPSNFNTAWINTYANIFNEAVLLRNKAAASGSNHYEGIANVLIAFHLMNATDVWGDIPYTQALNGLDNTSPTFDSQESLYAEAFSLLDAAIAKFGQAAGPQVPGSDDVINGGDITAWTQAAHAIKARGYLHLGLVDGANYTKALTSAASAFADASTELTLQYTSAQQGQWYRFNDGRTGDIEFHPTYRGIMSGMGDTRLSVLDLTYNTSHPYFVAAYNQPMITYREMKFLEAECLMQTGGSDAAIHAAWTAGVTAAFEHFGLGADAAAFLTANDPGVGNITMNDIMVQKNIALFGTMEPYNDWRRTDLPALTPNDGVAVPVRFPYADSEILFNNNAALIPVTTKVWWDRESKIIVHLFKKWTILLRVVHFVFFNKKIIKTRQQYETIHCIIFLTLFFFVRILLR